MCIAVWPREMEPFVLFCGIRVCFTGSFAQFEPSLCEETEGPKMHMEQGK